MLEEEFFPLLILCRKWLLENVGWLGGLEVWGGGLMLGMVETWVTQKALWLGSANPMMFNNFAGWVSLYMASPGTHSQAAKLIILKSTPPNTITPYLNYVIKREMLVQFWLIPQTQRKCTPSLVGKYIWWPKSLKSGTPIYLASFTPSCGVLVNARDNAGWEITLRGGQGCVSVPWGQHN